MNNYDSVDAMAGAYAERAVALANEFHIEFDYSESSLLNLETILNTLSAEMPDGKPSVEDLSEVCKIWGSYLGEVVRRRYGGAWSIETYPGKQFATLTLNVKGNKLFPSMKVHRRLTEGEGDNVWSFYRMVKGKLQVASQDRN